MQQNNGFSADAATAFTLATSGEIDKQLGERLANFWMSLPFLAFLAETTQSPVQFMTVISKATALTLFLFYKEHNVYLKSSQLTSQPPASEFATIADEVNGKVTANLIVFTGVLAIRIFQGKYTTRTEVITSRQNCGDSFNHLVLRAGKLPGNVRLGKPVFSRHELLDWAGPWHDEVSRTEASYVRCRCLFRA